MKPGVWMGLLVAAALCRPVWPQGEPRNPSKPVTADVLKPSEHRAGPHGPEGWTLEGPFPNGPGDKYQP